MVNLYQQKVSDITQQDQEHTQILDQDGNMWVIALSVGGRPGVGRSGPAPRQCPGGLEASVEGFWGGGALVSNWDYDNTISIGELALVLNQ